MKKDIIYETHFDRKIPELAFFSRPDPGGVGYTECEPHMHRHIEIHYLVTGSQTFMVDGHEYPLEGQFLFIFPYQIHSNHRNPDCRHVSTIVNPNAFEKYERKLIDYRPLSPTVPIEKLPSHFPELLKYANSLFFEEGNPDREQLLHDAMNLIIGETLNAMTLIPRTETMGNHDVPTLGRVIDYCVMHLSEDLTLASVADALYLNKFYISKLFSSKLGMTFSDFLNSQRVFCVCEKLVTCSEPITEIAYSCGFRNLSNFNRAFKARTGETPREYRVSHWYRRWF